MREQDLSQFENKLISVSYSIHTFHVQKNVMALINYDVIFLNATRQHFLD